MSKIENPPAFPIPAVPGPGGYDAHEGMSLRDWFAGQALAGALSSPSGPAWEAAAKQLGVEPDEALARGMYIIADAMLAEREKGGAA